MLKALRPVLFVGKCIGLVPYTCSLSHDRNTKTISSLGISRTIGAAIVLALTLHLSMYIIEFLKADSHHSPYDIAYNSLGVMLGIVELYCVIFLHFKSHQIVEAARHWDEVSNSTTEGLASGIPVKFVVIASLLMISAVGENMSYNLPSIVLALNEEKHGNYTNFWRNFVTEDYRNALQVIPYWQPFAVLLTIAGKLGWYALNLCDTLIFLIAAKVYNTFQSYNRNMLTLLESKLLHKNPDTWLNIAHSHGQLVNAFKVWCELLAPLIFALVTFETFDVSMHLAWYFRTDPVPFSYVKHYEICRQVYITWGSIHSVGKIFVVWFTVGKVPQHIHHFSNVLDKCPDSCYKNQVKRIDLKLQTQTNAFTGLNMFFITESFLLSLMGVIFTMELVLLQTPSTTDK